MPGTLLRFLTVIAQYHFTSLLMHSQCKSEAVFLIHSSQPNSHPIGIFDSGVGGFSLYQAIRHMCPNENLLYIAARPMRPLDELRAIATAITQQEDVQRKDYNQDARDTLG